MRANLPLALSLVTGCATAPSPSSSSTSATSASAPTAASPTDVSASRPVGRRSNPATLPRPNGYSHVVDVPLGRTLYISGQVPLDAAGNVVGAGDFRAQTEQVFANLASALASAGANFGHVVKITIFVTQLSPEHLGALREVRDRHLDPAHAPASSLVEVSRLFRPELLVEIEAIAVIPAE